MVDIFELITTMLWLIPVMYIGMLLFYWSITITIGTPCAIYEYFITQRNYAESHRKGLWEIWKTECGFSKSETITEFICRRKMSRLKINRSSNQE